MGNCCKTSRKTVVAPALVPMAKKSEEPLIAEPAKVEQHISVSEDVHSSKAQLSDPRRPRGTDEGEWRDSGASAVNYFEDSEEHPSLESLSLVAMFDIEEPQPAHPLVPKLPLEKLKPQGVLSTERVEEIRKRWSNKKQIAPQKLKLNLQLVRSSDDDKDEHSEKKTSVVRHTSLSKPPNLLEIMRVRSADGAKAEELGIVQTAKQQPAPPKINLLNLTNVSYGDSSDIQTSRVLDSTPVHMSEIATTATFPTLQSIQTGKQPTPSQLSLSQYTLQPEPPKYARHASLLVFKNETKLPGLLPIPFGERSTPVRMTETLHKQKGNGQIRLNEYSVLKELGAGAFGKVYEADKAGQKFAIKEYNKKKLKHKLMGKRKTAFDSVLEEVAILSRIDHPNIIFLHEVINSAESRKTYLIMDLAAKGSLQQMLPIPEPQAKVYFSQMVLAVEYLHEVVQVIHRDLKPENILLDAQNNVKISDFGSAQALLKPDDTFSNTPGTPAFMSPEQCGGTFEFLGKPLDIWALGVTLYYMLCNKPPFTAKRLGDLYESIKSQQYFPPRITIPSFISPLAQNLLNLMLTKDPRRRITIAEIKRHKWLDA